MKSSRLLLFITFLAAPAWSAEPTSAPSPAASATAASSTDEKPAPRASKKSRSKSSKGRRTFEKETEGTEAPDRFEADTVIKSQYQLNGQPLEVDPD